MVGEIRDPETAQIAIQSALTGHLVFTTVHANNVIDVLGPVPEHGRRGVSVRLGAELRAGAAARAAICEDCKRPATMTRELLIESAIDPELAPTRRRSTRASGCIECGGTGFKGRTAICELMDLTDRIRDMILERRPTSEIKKAARDEGMTFLRAVRRGPRARRHRRRCAKSTK